MNIEVSIIIVTWNNVELLRQCLNSVFEQTFKEFEVVVVDNGSRDGTAKFIKDNYPQVCLIENNRNEGACKARNQGIELARGRYILTLDTDVVLEGDFLKEMKEAAGRDGSDIGMVGAKILRRDGERIDSTGLVLSKRYRFYDRGSGQINNGQFDEETNIFGPCSAAALYKKEMLEDIKVSGEYFDPDFFYSLEDFDIAWRAHHRGWKAVFVPKAICYHTRWGSMHSRSFRQYLSFRNRYFLILKNQPKFGGLRNLTTFILYDIPRLGYLLVTNKYTIRALRELAKSLPSMLKKRSAVIGELHG